MSDSLKDMCGAIGQINRAVPPRDEAIGRQPRHAAGIIEHYNPADFQMCISSSSRDETLWNADTPRIPYG